MTHTLTGTGVRAFAYWHRAVGTQSGLYLPDKPILTPHAYASLFNFFVEQGSRFGDGPENEGSAVVHSRIVDTAAFREFLQLNATVFIRAGVVRASVSVAEPEILGTYGSFFMVNWAIKSSRAIAQPAFREIAVAYKDTDTSAAASWVHGLLEVASGDLILDGGHREPLYPSEDEYVIGVESVAFIRKNPDAIFIRLDHSVPALYSNQRVLVGDFIEDLLKLGTRMVLPPDIVDRLRPWSGMSLRVFMETCTSQFLLKPRLPSPARPVLPDGNGASARDA